MQAGYGEGHLNILSSERTPRIGASSGSPGLLQPILYIYKFITRTIVVYFYDNFPLPMPDGHSTTAPLACENAAHPRQARNAFSLSCSSPCQPLPNRPLLTRTST